MRRLISLSGCSANWMPGLLASSISSSRMLRISFLAISQWNRIPDSAVVPGAAAFHFSRSSPPSFSATAYPLYPGSAQKLFLPASPVSGASRPSGARPGLYRSSRRRQAFAAWAVLALSPSSDPPHPQLCRREFGLILIRKYPFEFTWNVGEDRHRRHRPFCLRMQGLVA